MQTKLRTTLQLTLQFFIRRTADSFNHFFQNYTEILKCMSNPPLHVTSHPPPLTKISECLYLNQNYLYASLPNTNLLKQLNLCSPYIYPLIFFFVFSSSLTLFGIAIFYLFPFFVSLFYCLCIVCLFKHINNN